MISLEMVIGFCVYMLLGAMSMRAWLLIDRDNCEYFFEHASPLGQFYTLLIWPVALGIIILVNLTY